MKDIFYFHGLNSSPATDKVARLKSLFPDDNVYAFAIDRNQEKAESELTDQINWALATNLYSNGGIYFVGTSFGGYWAGRMAKEYGIPMAVMINPVIDPETQLGVEFSGYKPLNVDGKNQVFVLSENDEVLDHNELKKLLAVSGVDFHQYQESHRFNGSSFEEVCKKFVV